ncbi:MAG: hypothetical protein K9M08_06960 [Pirellula sp.]|nr:hypothetical protein [Pirellula sp.]
MTDSSAVENHYFSLAEKCAGIVKTSLGDPQRSAQQGTSGEFLLELEVWVQAVTPSKCSELIKSAAFEYQFALLAVSQGQYRNAFKGLRLTLELILQSVQLSTDEVKLRQWLNGKADTSWAAIMDDERGVFSRCVADAFNQSFLDDIKHFASIAARVYRDLSQYVHGNIGATSAVLEFDNSMFERFHNQADLVAYVSSFALTLRHVTDELPIERLRELDKHISVRLGNLESVRNLLLFLNAE